MSRISAVDSGVGGGGGVKNKSVVFFKDFGCRLYW